MTTVLPNPAYTRMRLLGMAYQIVACDKAKRGCGASRGAPCISSGGYQNSLVGPHKARRDALAALGLSDDGKVAEMEKVCAEIDARRRQGQAAIDKMRNDPEIRAAQARSGDAWRQVLAEQRKQEVDFRARCTDEPFRSSRTHVDDCRCRLDGDVRLKSRPKVVPIGVAPLGDLAAARARRAARSGSPRGVA